MDNHRSSVSKVDRKTIEKKRREEMKALFAELNSLVPHQQGSGSREHAVLSDQVQGATKYINELQARLESLKEKKRNLILQSNQSIPRSNTRPRSEPESPLIEVHARGNSALEVVLITGLDCYTIFKEAISVLHDEGVDIVNASFSVVDDTSMLHSIHGKIEESTTDGRIVGRITERLELMMRSLHC